MPSFVGSIRSERAWQHLSKYYDTATQMRSTCSREHNSPAHITTLSRMPLRRTEPHRMAAGHDHSNEPWVLLRPTGFFSMHLLSIGQWYGVTYGGCPRRQHRVSRHLTGAGRHNSAKLALSWWTSGSLFLSAPMDEPHPRVHPVKYNGHGVNGSLPVVLKPLVERATAPSGPTAMTAICTWMSSHVHSRR